MNAILSMFLWGLAGAGLAFLSIKSQTWSVIHVSPDHPGRSMTLVVGGAIVRWLVTAVVLVLALSSSFWAMLLTFIVFIISRTLFISFWQDALIQKPLRAKQIKD
jgi:hypothetical protein